MTKALKAGIVAEVSKIAYAQHLLEGHQFGNYTLGEVVQYWRTHEDLSWQIDCIPSQPKDLSALLDTAERTLESIQALIITHVHTSKDQYGQCQECKEYLYLD